VDLADRLRENVGAEVGQVVAVHGRDHRVLELHRPDRLGDARRLGDVVLGRTAMGHGAVGAVSRADIAQNHERRGPVLPALADVGAMGFLAHRVEIEIPH